jgi:hypothetical protein
VFTVVDCGTDWQYVVTAKLVEESTVRLLVAVYTDRFRTYNCLERTGLIIEKRSFTAKANTLVERCT